MCGLLVMATLYVILAAACRPTPAPVPRPTSPPATPTLEIPPTTQALPTATSIPPTPTLSRAVKERQAGADVASQVQTIPSGEAAPSDIPALSTSASRFAVLLLGYGGADHEGPYLTDSMVLAIVDQNQKSLTLLSLPRDSWVPLEFDGQTRVYNKVNTAFAFAKDPGLYPDRLARYNGPAGAGAFAQDTVSRLVGVPVSYYLGLDFEGFRDMINTVGGVQVDVPDSFTAQYPANDNDTVDASWTTVHFSEGTQTMNGERAIEYARAREVLDNLDEGSDFARSRRQRLIMEAFKTRLLQPGGLIHLPQLLGIAASHVDTNYTVPDATMLGQMILGWRDVHIYQTALSTTNYLAEGTSADGGYILVPSTPDQSWNQIRAFGRHLWNNPQAGVAMARARVAVVNRSGTSGLATRVGSALVSLGYQVANITTDSYLAQSRLVDDSGGDGTVLAGQLGTDLGLPNLTVVSNSSADPPGDSPQVELDLGADAASLTLDVPSDASAPTSSYGVVHVGSWDPAYAATSSPSAAAGSTGSVTSTPTPAPLASPPTEMPRPSPTSVPPVKPVVAPNNPNYVLVPKLVGLSEADAQRVINESRLMTSYVNYQTIAQVADKTYFRSVRPGAVLSQQPLPGTAVPPGTRVYLAVRKS